MLDKAQVDLVYSVFLDQEVKKLASEISRSFNDKDIKLVFKALAVLTSFALTRVTDADDEQQSRDDFVILLDAIREVDRNK